MTKASLLFLTFWASNMLVLGQKNLHNPLEIPITLSAGFCDLRTNHFHMGIDIRTNGKEGLKVFAIDSGYVSRIKCSTYGYGKVIYIAHPSGITSVYAHCSKYKGKLDSLVKAKQLEEQDFEVELTFEPNQVPIKRGELIALSGNTGHSFAPHLHFEIRDTKTDNALNALNYFQVSDKIKPVIKQIRISALTQEGYVIPGKSKAYKVTPSSGSYTVADGKISIPKELMDPAGLVGIELETSDDLNSSCATISAFEHLMLVDGDSAFCQRNDHCSFEFTRYINDLNLSGDLQKLYRTKQNLAEVYKLPNLGIIDLNSSTPRAITIKAKDISKNTVSLSLKLSGSVPKGQEPFTFDPATYFIPDSAYTFTSDSCQFYTEPFTFYSPQKKVVSTKPAFQFGNKGLRIQKPIRVKLKPANPKYLNNYYIQCTHGSSKKSALESHVENDWIVAESKETGIFSLCIDTLAPKVSPKGFDASSTSLAGKTIYWSISDSQNDITDYDLFIDGKWNLVEHEYKDYHIFSKLPSSLKGKHELKLLVKDRLGNTTTWKKTIAFE
jgi:hypothetical protein